MREEDHEYEVQKLKETIKELEHKIEKMKNCGNCNNEKDAGFWSEPFCGISGCVDNDKWEILK